MPETDSYDEGTHFLMRCKRITIIVLLNTMAIYTVLSSTAKPYVGIRSGHPSESRTATGGSQLVGQAANLVLESACRLL